MSIPIRGLHHVTALAGDPRRNDAFWSRTLGLRRVKKTINFDDPGTYHLYFGDSAGRPGSLMTFFPHPLARRGVAGAPEVATTSFAVPPGALEFWRARLAAAGVTATQHDDGPAARLELADPDGTSVALVEAPDAGDFEPWADEVPADRAIRRLAGITLHVRDADATRAFLTDAFGYEPSADDPAALALPGRPEGGTVTVVADSGPSRRRMGAGSVHHVAFRVADDAAQLAALDELAARGFGPTTVQDRQYFRSVYFLEPGGVIFEIATDPPGFATDEPTDALGTTLQLPPWLEGRRSAIEDALVPLESERAAGGAA